VVVALLQVNDNVEKFLSTRLNLEPALSAVLGHGGYQLLGVLLFAGLGLLLFRAGLKPSAKID
jgi:hypothetical protein